MYKTKLIVESDNYKFEKSLTNFLNSSEVNEIIDIEYSAIDGSNIDYNKTSKLQTAVNRDTNSMIYTALIIYK